MEATSEQVSFAEETPPPFEIVEDSALESERKERAAEAKKHKKAVEKWKGKLKEKEAKYKEKNKLLESGASSSQTPRARTAWLGSENSWKGALA